MEDESPPAKFYPLVLLPGRTGAAASQPQSSRVSAFLVKLTDTSLRALKLAQKPGSGGSSKIHIEVPMAKPTTSAEAGTLIIGDQRYAFSTTDIQKEVGGQGSQEAVCFCDDPRTHDAQAFAWLGGIRQRFQILATDDTYAETRQKALQMQDEEQKKSGSKELKVKAQKAGGGQSKKLTAIVEKIRNTGPSFQPASGRDSPTPPAPPSAARPLRQRVMHLIVIKKMTKAEIVARLHLQDADAKALDAVLADVAISVLPAEPDKFILKPSLYSEIDLNWPHFTKFDKQTVKSKIEKSKHPSIKIPSSSSSSTAAGGAGAPPPAPATKKDKSNILDTLLPPTTPTPDSGPTRKRLQPPPAPSRPQAAPDGGPAAKKRSPGTSTTVANGIGTTTTSPSPPPPVEPPPPPPPLPPPSPAPSPASTPTTDWTEELPAVQTAAERLRYAQMFSEEYDEYMRCYHKLAEVTREFNQLEYRLNKAPKDTKEHRKIEREIVTKYRHYESDEEFTRMRRKHNELRAKLAFIKQRVKDWDDQLARNQDRSRLHSSPSSSPAQRVPSVSLPLPPTVTTKRFVDKTGFADLTVM